jgi:hypothetical protein
MLWCTWIWENEKRRYVASLVSYRYVTRATEMSSREAWVKNYFLFLRGPGFEYLIS